MSTNFNANGIQRELTFLLLGLLVAVIIGVILMAAVPPVSRDALTHHLAIPKLYLQQGGVYEMPGLKYSYYPMNLDLLYLAALYFKNDIVPKYIHFAFGLLTAWIIYTYLIKRLNRPYALLGVISFLSIPVIIKLSITVYVDLGLVFFSTAALMLIFKWMDAQYRLRYLIAAAICCGLAIGTKYNGLLVLFLLALFVPYAYVRMNPTSKGQGGRAIFFTLAFILVALIVFSPWMIRNYVWTHNPIFPLYDAFFNPDAPFQAIPLKPFLERRLIYQESWPQIILIPFRIFFQGQDNNPQFFDGRLNPLLLLLPLLAFWRAKLLSPSQKMERKLMAIFAILYILYAFFTKDMRVRYIAPALPALVILSIFGLKNLYGLAQSAPHQTIKRGATMGCHAAVALMLILNGFYMVALFKEVAPVSYITGQIDRDAYIQRYRPEYAALQYVNANLPKDARLLALFLGRRSYYCNREMVFGTELLKDITSAAASPEGIRREIADQNFTHLIVGRRLYDKWHKQNFDSAASQRLIQFWRLYTSLVNRQAGYEIYQLHNGS
jgi:4-amino-4-deoxy-L-arabinose transferase-like glycosyltransferase